MTEGILKGYFNLLCQQFCVPKLHLEKGYLKPLKNRVMENLRVALANCNIKNVFSSILCDV